MNRLHKNKTYIFEDEILIQIGAEHGEVHGNAVVSFSICAKELAMEHGVRIRDQDT